MFRAGFFGKALTGPTAAVLVRLTTIPTSRYGFIIRHDEQSYGHGRAT